jgi:hypothetical protein
VPSSRFGNNQESGWLAPCVSSRDTLADPVREVAFTFYNNALYQVIGNFRP